jgi:hypothetical protein
MSKAESRPRLTVARKFELYLATRPANAPLGEILRQYGVHVDDLRSIERTVESAALAGLKGHGHHQVPVPDFSPAQAQQLEQELAEKTQALAELSVAYTLLEKKDRAESRASMLVSGSRRRSSK